MDRNANGFFIIPGLYDNIFGRSLVGARFLMLGSFSMPGLCNIYPSYIIKQCMLTICLNKMVKTEKVMIVIKTLHRGAGYNGLMLNIERSISNVEVEK
jgi:hypothetical protein